MEIECPNCGEENLDIEDHLPPRACDTSDYECDLCGFEFGIGWSADAEVRPLNKPKQERTNEIAENSNG